MNSFRSLKLLGVIILLALCVLIICRYWSVNDTQKPFSRIATNQAGAAPNLGFSGSGASPARAATATSSGKAKGKSSYASGTVGLTKLLARGVKIDSRELPADTTGRWIRETLYQTDFKYPLIRVDETLKSNTDGNPIVVNRVAMAADHVLVQFAGASTDVQLLAQDIGSKNVQATHTPGLYLIKTPNPSLDSVQAILDTLKTKYISFVSAEPDYLVEASLTPNNPFFGMEWGLSNAGQTGGLANADIEALNAWNIGIGSSSVRVAVIDTGIDYTHPDLVDNIWNNPSGSTGNGFANDTHGWNFYANTNDPMDDNNHGTHSAGTLGADGNSGVGVTGVCWNVSLVAVKFLSSEGVGTTSDAVDAINYATLIGVDVMSNSWGGGAYSLALKAAIDNANAQGILFVAAAGNGGLSGIGQDNDLMPVYPASYPCDNIISVAATDDNDQLTSFSNYGVSSVHLAAPGSGIYSTIIGGLYATYAGTSTATPYVAGACALLKSAGLGLTSSQIKARILATVDQLPGLQNKLVSGGRLNLFAAMTGTGTQAMITSGTSASATVGAFFSYAITASNSPTSFYATGLPDGFSINNATGVISGTPAATGTFVVNLEAFSHGNGTASATLTLIVTPPAPVITSGTLSNGVAWSPFSYPIVGTNAPTSYEADNLPPGLTCDSNLGIISGAPTASGTTIATIVASNAGGSGSSTLCIVISTPPVPQITSALNLSAVVGSPFIYTITATNNPSGFSATGLPQGLQIDLSTGIISGTPASAGQGVITINATNQTGTGSTTLNLTLNNPAAPEITSASSATAIVGTQFNYTIAATNNPASFSATGLPSGLSLDPVAGVISGSPVATGTFNATIAATNAGGTGLSPLIVTVNLPKPVITSAVTTVTMGNPFSYSIIATNSPTGYTATPLPTGLSLDSIAGAISGTPSVSGTYTITIGAGNASGTATGTLTLIVLPLAPVITSPTSATANAGSAFSYTITATNAPASYSAGGLPPGLFVNASTGLIYGNPQSSGTFLANISATNGGGTGTAQLTLVVNSGPPSILSFTPTSAPPGATVTVQGTGLSSATSVVITDKGSGMNMPAQFSVVSDATLQFKVPNLSSFGMGAVITIVGSNGATVTIPSNATLVTGTVNGIGGINCLVIQNGGALYNSGGSNTTYLESGAYVAAGGGFNVYYVEDGATLDLSGGGGWCTVFYSAQSTIISGASISSVANGNYTMVAALSQSIVPALFEILAPPQITSTNAVAGQIGVPFEYAITANNQPQSFSATGLPAGLSLDQTTGTISGTPAAAGVSVINLSASNGDGATSMALTLTVTDPLVPIINSATTVAAALGAPVSYLITASNSPTSFSATGLPQGLNFDTTTGIISGTPANAGTYTITLGATNLHGTGSAVLLLLIGTAPTTITGISPAQAGSDATINLQGTGFFGATSVLFTGMFQPVSAAFSVTSATSMQVIVPRIPPMPQGYAMTVITPSGATVTVPSYAQDITTSANYGGGLNFYVVESGASLSGGGGLNIIYVKSGASASCSGGGLTIYYLEDGAFLDLAGVGGQQIVYYAAGATVTNPNPGFTTLVQVAGMQQSPMSALFQILPTPYITNSQSATGLVGTPFSFILSAANSPTTFTSSALPPGLSLDSSTGIISGLPTAAGNYVVTVTAANGDGTGSAILTINIAANVPPFITSAATASGSISKPFLYTITATNGATSFSASGLPSGLSLDSATGVISGTPATGGAFSVLLGATNAYGSGTQTLTLLVNVNPTRITSYSPSSPATSSTMTLTGQGFTGATSVVFQDGEVSFSNNGLVAGVNANFTVQSDNSIQAVVPNLMVMPFQGASVMVISPSGATLLVPASATVISSNTSAGGGFNFFVVNPGAALTDGGGFNEVYLEAGSTGVFTGGGGNVYFVENNATLNITGPGGMLTVYASPGATILNPSNASFNLIPVAGMQQSPVSSLPFMPPIPTITSSTNATTVVGQPFTYGIAAFNGPASYSASGLPAGLSIDPEAGIISGTPTLTGTYSVVLDAINSNGTGTATLNLTVRNLLLPVITSASTAYAEIGQPFLFTVTATNSPTLFAAGQMPPGLSLDPGSGIISGTPSTSGLFSIGLTASDADGSGTGTLSLTVDDPFADWQEMFATMLSGSGAGLTGSLADPAHDGISNLMKYALGLNPLVPCKAGILPSGHITNVSGAHYIDFQFRRLKGSGTGTTERGYTVGGLTYVVEVSSDLVNWSTGAALMSQLGLPIDNGDSSETVTVRVNPPASSGKKQFVRLKVISLKH